MIRKLAQELAEGTPSGRTARILASYKFAEDLDTNDLVLGENETAPLDPDAPPEAKEDSTIAPEFGFTENTTNTHNETMHGTLDRTLDEYGSATKDYNSSMARILGSHVRTTSGSPAVTKRAVQRFLGRDKD